MTDFYGQDMTPSYDYLLQLYQNTEQKTNLHHRFLYHVTKPYSDPEVPNIKPETWERFFSAYRGAQLHTGKKQLPNRPTQLSKVQAAVLLD